MQRHTDRDRIMLLVLCVVMFFLLWGRRHG
jgi:hypothetical protein